MQMRIQTSTRLFVSLSGVKALNNRGSYLNWQALDLGLTADSGVYSELLAALCGIVGQLRKNAEAQLAVKVTESLLPTSVFFLFEELSVCYSRVKREHEVPSENTLA